MVEVFSQKYPNASFGPGLDLAEGFFEEAVRPMLKTHLPELGENAKDQAVFPRQNLESS